jgi:hypothetical protein
VEPGEDARVEAKKYAKLLGEYSDSTIDKIAALITARDERIRRECKRAVLRQFDECDGVTGEYCLDGKWYIGRWGCDTLDHIMDAIVGGKE